MKGLLVVCGLGCDPRREATLEVLASLAACETRFCDARPETRAWLAERVGPLEDANDPARVVAAAKRGLTGLAVWGHPTATSRFALRALDAAAKAGVDAKVLAGITPVSHAMAAGGRALGWRADEDSGWTAAPAGSAPPALARPVAVFDAGEETVVAVVPRPRGR
jgi:hypothetical protein